MNSNSTSPSNRFQKSQRPFFIVIGIALFLFAIPGIIIPGIAKILIPLKLTEMGADNVEIDDISINPFSGEITVRGFVIQGSPIEKGTVKTDPVTLDLATQDKSTQQDLVSLDHLHINIALTKLLKKQIHIEEFTLSGLSLLVEETQPLQYKVGVPLPQTEPAEPETDADADAESILFDWGFGLANTKLENIQVNFHSQEFNSTVTIDSAHLNLFTTWNPDTNTKLQLITHLSHTPQANKNTTPPLEHVEGTLSLDLDTRIELLRALEGKHSLGSDTSGLITFNNIRVISDQFDLNNLEVQWQGKTSTQTSLDTGETTLNQDAELALNNLAIALRHQPMRATNKSIVWKGSTQLNSNDIESSLKVSGDLAIHEFSSYLLTPAIELAHMKELTLSSIDVTGLNQQTLSAFEIKQFSVLPDSEQNSSLLSLEHLHIDNIQFDHLQNLLINQIKLKGLTSTVKMDKEGKVLRLDDTLNALTSQNELENKGSANKAIANESTPNKSNPTQKNQPKDDIQISINNVTIDENSFIALSDDSIAPTFNTTFDLQNFQLGPIDSANESTTTQFNIAGTVGEFSQLVTQGEIQIFPTKKNGHIKTTLSSMALPPLSPYAAQAIGYKLESGQFNSDMAVSITDNILKGNNKVVIANLDIMPQDEELIKKLTTKISMPLDLALSILKNKKGDIEINIPIEGDLDNPAIDVGNVITSALAKAVRKGSLSYLKFALQPYGAAIMILEKTAKHLNEVRLNPIEFQPNSITLNQDHQQYMDKIATILDKSPGLRIRLCSISTHEDKIAYADKLNESQPNKESKKDKDSKTKAPKDSAIKDTLFKDNVLNDKASQEYLTELGRLRATAIKNYLIDEHAVNTNKLFICHPTIAKDDSQGKPRTELKI